MFDFLLKFIPGGAALAKLRKIALIGAGVASLFVWFKYDQQAKGARKQLQRTETANVKARDRADAAARKSADPAARGVLNPYYRPD